MVITNRNQRRNRSSAPFVAIPLLLLAIVCHGEYARGEDHLARLEERLLALEQQVELLRGEIEAFRRAGPPPPEVPTAQPPPATVEVVEGGTTLRAGDGSLAVRLRGSLHVDSRTYMTEDDLPGNDTFLIRRFRPVVEATAFRNFEFRAMPDLSGPSLTLMDANVNWRISPQFQLRAGKMKGPMGLERLQSLTALTFVERGLPTHLAPNRDIGVQAHGSLLTRRVDYTVGLFNGTKDGGSSVADGDDGKDLAVRVFTHPFRNLDHSPVQGMGIGIAGTYGRHEGVPRAYATTGQQDFFRFRPGVVNDGLIRRVAPQGYLYSGPVGVLWEWTQSSQELRLGGDRGTVRNRAWQVLGSYLITGEDAAFGAVRPRRNLAPGDGGWGALEVVARVGRLSIDERAYPLLADPGAGASEARNFTLGFNWYLNRSVKYTMDFGRTAFESPAGGSRKRPAENALFARVQFLY